MQWCSFELKGSHRILGPLVFGYWRVSLNTPKLSQHANIGITLAIFGAIF